MLLDFKPYAVKLECKMEVILVLGHTYGWAYCLSLELLDSESYVVKLECKIEGKPVLGRTYGGAYQYLSR